MDRLPVFKALGDNTRYAIFLELARSAAPLSTADIAAALDLHPNTVRPHLELDADSRGTVGRPQHRYSLAADAPSLGLEPSRFRMLARLLASVAAAGGLSGDDVATVARAEGHSLGIARRASAASCLAALVSELEDLGFDPASATDGTTTTVAFTRCPFSELANAFPEIVCHLHRGIVEGMVDELSGVGGGDEVTIERFATLADRDPCRVDLAVR